jgi:Bacterial regulatory proteins, luxR family
VTEREFTQARSAILTREEPPPALFEECRRIVALMVRTSGLPVHYSPYGVWSQEAIEEVLAGWAERRLIGRGQLLALMQRAPVLPVFRRMAETSVRQYLIDSRKRSQAANLHDRVKELLLEDQRFTDEGGGSGALWRFEGGADEPFTGADRDLAAVAWSLGDFKVIRYDPEAKKLSPLLEHDELLRFIEGMLAAGAMSVSALMQALHLRFAIDDSLPNAELNPGIAAEDEGPEAEALFGQLATSTLSELSNRQAQVLIGMEHGETTEQIADRLGCSTGTVSTDRRALEAILARLGADAGPVLKLVLDALFLEDG